MTSSRRFIVTLFSRYNYGTDFLFFRIHLHAGKDHRRDAEDEHDHAVDRVQMPGKKADAQSSKHAEDGIEHALHLLPPPFFLSLLQYSTTGGLPQQNLLKAGGKYATIN